MKRGFTLFLKIVILLIASGVLAAMIRFPQTEGRAANLDLISIYTDPFIIYMYIASIPFFVALFQIITLLSFVEKNKLYSEAALKAVRNIKYCSLLLIVFIVAAISYIVLTANRTNEDPVGFVAIGTVAILISTVFATTAAIFQKRLQHDVRRKLKNPK